MWLASLAVVSLASPAVTLDLTTGPRQVQVTLELPAAASPVLPSGARQVERSPSGEGVRLRYVVALGEPGRHGHQGWLTDSWGTFDGRVLPRVEGLGTVNVRIVAPEGWVVAAPWEGTAAFDDLRRGCVAAGALQGTEGAVGSTTVRAWAPRGQPLGPRALELARHIPGFDPGGVVQIVMLPAEPRVYGGASATSLCASHDGGTRDWELLAHRLAHVVDKYPVAALRLSEARDAWFVEGWATWQEAVATEAVGLVADRSHLQTLAARAATEAPAVPLAELQTAAPDDQEALHYVVAPVVVDRLDALLRARTGRSVDDFVRHVVTRPQPVDLRAELASWSGTSLDDFWARQVDALP